MIKINITNYLNEEAYYTLCEEFEEMIKKNKFEVKILNRTKIRFQITVFSLGPGLYVVAGSLG